MFLKYPDGTLEVITGPMFAGKTEELLKRINILSIAKINTLIIKPRFDTRFSFDNIVSRNGKFVKAINIEKPSEILEHFDKSFKSVAIDEVHFFDDEIIDVINKLTNNGVRVIVSGLDMDYMMRPFGVVPKLLAIADEISKLKSVCVVCHSVAAFSFRKDNSTEIRLLGDNEYEARCRHCHVLGTKIKKGRL